jgi:hypothetical protein
MNGVATGSVSVSCLVCTRIFFLLLRGVMSILFWLLQIFYFNDKNLVSRKEVIGKKTLLRRLRQLISGDVECICSAVQWNVVFTVFGTMKTK